MQYEVEQKHRVDNLAQLIVRLEARGVQFDEPVEQVDEYFAHPARDFAQTDEALRIRTTAGRPFITYKGPKLDSTTKTRREIELPLPEDGRRFVEILTALGFKTVATVRKHRRVFHLSHDGQEVEGAIDEVDDVGSFVELELQADDDSLAEAQHIVSGLASELNLGDAERRSYLEMLLANR